MELEPRHVRQPPGPRPPAPPIVEDPDHQDEPTFGQVVRKAREARSLTEEEFAAAFGISRTYLVQVEQDIRVPTTLMVKDLVELLGMSEPELLAIASRHPRYWPGS